MTFFWVLLFVAAATGIGYLIWKEVSTSKAVPITPPVVTPVTPPVVTPPVTKPVEPGEPPVAIP